MDLIGKNFDKILIVLKFFSVTFNQPEAYLITIQHFVIVPYYNM